MLYLAGSLIFAIALVLALAVIAANLVHYRTQMVAALRTLSLDGVHDRRTTATVRPSAPVFNNRPARPVRQLVA